MSYLEGVLPQQSSGKQVSQVKTAINLPHSQTALHRSKRKKLPPTFPSRLRPFPLPSLHHSRGKRRRSSTKPSPNSSSLLHLSSLPLRSFPTSKSPRSRFPKVSIQLNQSPRPRSSKKQLPLSLKLPIFSLSRSNLRPTSTWVLDEQSLVNMRDCTSITK